jgi:hypothetical protein
MGLVAITIRRIRVCGPTVTSGKTLIRAPRNLTSILWVLIAPEIGDTITCNFCVPGVMSTNMGVCGCDDMCRYDAWRGKDWGREPTT